MKNYLPKFAACAAVCALSLSFTAKAGDYDHATGTSTHAERGISSVTFTDAAGNSGSVAGLVANSSGRDIYVDQTDTKVTLAQGIPVSISAQGGGSWIHTYFFIDYDKDGEFEADFVSDTDFTVTDKSELVTYNLYQGSGSTWYNSLGALSVTSGAAQAAGPDPALPAFTIPSDLEPGEYRARYIIRWNSVDPTGNENDSDGKSMATNGGEMIDFVINVISGKGTVSITEPEAGSGTLQVFNGEETVTDGSTFALGTQLKVVATAADGYAIRYVKANDTELEGEDGVYNYTVVGDVNFSANIYEVASYRPAVTISAPAEEQGSLKVYNGDTEIKSGDEVANGTVLTIVPEAGDLYSVASVTVNDEAIEANEGVYSYTVNGADITVSATFNAISYSYKTGTVSSTAGRGITSITISDENSHSTSVTGNGTANRRNVFVDQTSTVAELSAGSAISFSVSGSGEWMHTYFYIDYNHDGVFTPVLTEAGGAAEDSELVTFNAYSTDSQNYINSLGETVEAHQMIATPGLPTFTIPEEYAGHTFRARYKVDWNDTDPLGGSQIASAGGTMMDFIIKVVKPTPVSHTVAVASAKGDDGKQYGSVAINGSDALYVDTTESEATVVATPAQDAQFMYWKDAQGNVVSTDATYTFNVTANATLTATFGFELVTESTDGGTFHVEYGNTELSGNSKDVVEGGKNAIAIIDSIDDSCKLGTTKVNGEAVDFTNEDGDIYYDFVIDQPYTISVEFSKDSSGVSNIAVDANNGVAEYYNLNGMRVNEANLTSGLYIRRAGNAAEKVVIK
jgi:hypothetical protein